MAFCGVFNHIALVFISGWSLYYWCHMHYLKCLYIFACTLSAEESGVIWLNTQEKASKRTFSLECFVNVLFPKSRINFDTWEAWWWYFGKKKKNVHLHLRTQLLLKFQYVSSAGLTRRYPEVNAAYRSLCWKRFTSTILWNMSLQTVTPQCCANKENY